MFSLVPLRLRLIRLSAACLALAAVASATPEKWAGEIAAFTKFDTTHPSPRDAIVFVGSSSINNWKSVAQDFPGLPVLNRGFGGSELADSVFYFDQLVAPHRPRLVVLYAGENDLTANKTPERIAADFRAFCAKLDGAFPQAKLIYISIKPSPSRVKYLDAMKRANALIAAECQGHPRRTFVDIFPRMLDANGQPRPELFVKDMLHMNPQGYAIWIEQLKPLLKP